MITAHAMHSTAEITIIPLSMALQGRNIQVITVHIQPVRTAVKRRQELLQALSLPAMAIQRLKTERAELR